VEAAYNRMHQLGYAHCAEAWQGDQLVGGLYGIRIGNSFFGESMFSLVSNASRFAFTKYVQQLASEDVKIIDCQVFSEYLESMGAKMISREAFLQEIKT
jgi:leucyl/phenylalanyl-tRNA--protein transferase